MCNLDKLIFVPMGDFYEKKDLAKAIIMLLTNEKLNQEYKEKEKLRINDFSKDKIIKKWLDIIER